MYFRVGNKRAEQSAQSETRTRTTNYQRKQNLFSMVLPDLTAAGAFIGRLVEQSTNVDARRGAADSGESESRIWIGVASLIHALARKTRPPRLAALQRTGKAGFV